MYPFVTLSGLLDFIDTQIQNKGYLNYIEDNSYVSISSSEFVEQTKRLSFAFSEAGVKKGTTVAIVSASSPFWLMVDFALMRIGAVGVPIFANISSSNLIYEIKDAQIEYMFIASQERLDTLKPYLDDMKLVLYRDLEYAAQNGIEWSSFISKASIDRVDHKVSSDDLATIIYTSGSTGRPKGVELTHKNFVTQLNDTKAFYSILKSDIVLSFLPLAHVFERMVMMFYMSSGASIYFVDDVKKIALRAKEVKPTVMSVVPRLLNKIYAKMLEGVERSSGVKKIIGRLAVSHAMHKDPQSDSFSLVEPIYDKLVYAKLREALGGKLRIVISGGAPLKPTVCRFFINIKVPIYQGYGLSETSPVISANRVHYNRIGTCGKLFNHVEAKIGDSSELLVRGDSVMRGYHNLPEKTAQTIDSDGWLHTGDIAEFDSDGYLTIKGRLKELLKTSTGKYISAIPIEHCFVGESWIEQAMVVADNRPFVTILLFVNTDDETTDEIHSRAQELLDKINQTLPKWERVQRFAIIEDEPTIESGVLTPSMKLVRDRVLSIYEEHIEQMYQPRFCTLEKL